MLPDEQLAIKTDNPSWYVNRDQRALGPGELTPRHDDEEHKSAWAYSGEHRSAAVLGQPPTLRLQAAAMLISSAQTQERTRVKGVHAPRLDVRPACVIPDSDEHVLPDYDESHRSLRTRDEQCRQGIHEGCQFTPWKYSRDMLLVELEAIVASGRMRTQYRAAAERLLARSLGN
jgi:hypothetical protein